MESVEALWAAYFGDANSPILQPGISNAGVVVLETGRVFGGDVQFYYLGEYTVTGDTIRAKITCQYFNGPGYTAFGPVTKGSFDVEMEGTRSGDQITGMMWSPDNPQAKLPILLKHLAPLPG